MVQFAKSNTCQKSANKYKTKNQKQKTKKFERDHTNTRWLGLTRRSSGRKVVGGYRPAAISCCGAQTNKPKWHQSAQKRKYENKYWRLQPTHIHRHTLTIPTYEYRWPFGLKRQACNLLLLPGAIGARARNTIQGRRKKTQKKKRTHSLRPQLPPQQQSHNGV